MSETEFGRSSLVNEIAFQGYQAWVVTKEALRLPTKNDQFYYLDRFARLLRNGKIGRDCKIMATGKNDGAGSQAEALMSAIGFAHAFGLEYVHRPFVMIEHAEMEMSDWVHQWEEYFNLGHGARRQDECPSPIVPLDQVRRYGQPWDDDVIVSTHQYLHCFRQDPGAWDQARPIIRRRYFANKIQPGPRPFTIAVHVRRGDRFAPTAMFINALRTVTAAVSELGRGFSYPGFFHKATPRCSKNSRNLIASFA
jgi:hypothetical protein